MLLPAQSQLWVLAYQAPLSAAPPTSSASLTRQQLPTAISSLRSQLWNLSTLLQTHAHPRRPDTTTIVEEPFYKCLQSVLQFCTGNGLHKVFGNPICQVSKQKDLELTMFGLSSSLIKKLRTTTCLGKPSGPQMGSLNKLLTRMSISYDKGSCDGEFPAMLASVGVPSCELTADQGERLGMTLWQSLPL